MQSGKGEGGNNRTAVTPQKRFTSNLTLHCSVLSVRNAGRNMRGIFLYHPTFIRHSFNTTSLVTLQLAWACAYFSYQNSHVLLPGYKVNQDGVMFTQSFLWLTSDLLGVPLSQIASGYLE